MIFTLEQYVAQANSWNAIFGKPGINLSTISAEECQQLADQMDSEMSPENLTCDGELSGAQVRVKRDRLLGAWKGLCELCDERGYERPRTHELA